MNKFEGPPGGSREMVWAPCPQRIGKGSFNDAGGKCETCTCCSGKGQIKTR